MTTNLFQQIKPIQVDISGVRRVNWKWLLQRSPILALGIDSSYNVAKYVGIDGTPLIIQIITGVTFDLIFVGMIALADQFRNDKLWSNVLFWIINAIAMLVAATLGTLAYSYGLYYQITFESATRGIAFPLLGLLYNLYYHTVTSEIMEDQRKQAKKEADRIANAAALKLLHDEEDRKTLLAFPFQCEYCERRFETIKQRNGHYSKCLVAKQQKASKE
jgi:hypothetical protein